MDFHYIPAQDPSKPLQRSRRLTLAQVRLLETSFTADHKLQAERKLQLAARLGVSPRQVAIWYQNRRARQKTQTREYDYRRIQMRLEDVLAEKRRLEEEVVMLRHELNKAQQQMLFLASSGTANSAANTDLPSVSVSGVDDQANSDHNYNCSEENNVAPLPAAEELYTCLSPWP